MEPVLTGTAVPIEPYKLFPHFYLLVQIKTGEDSTAFQSDISVKKV